MPIFMNFHQNFMKLQTFTKVINYDKFQYVDKEQPHTDHISQQGLNNKSNTQNYNLFKILYKGVK